MAGGAEGYLQYTWESTVSLLSTDAVISRSGVPSLICPRRPTPRIAEICLGKLDTVGFDHLFVIAFATLGVMNGLWKWLRICRRIVTDFGVEAKIGTNELGYSLQHEFQFPRAQRT